MPRILLQQGINLVNKLALLLHKSWLREDSWDKPKNDWCWGRGFSLLASKQRSVAYSNKVMDTRLPQPAGCGDKYDVSGLGYRLLRHYIPRNDAERNNIAFKGLDVVCQYAALLERRVQTGTRARKALVVTRQTNPLGRSMIEMLGVLAIIAVLSVGGIAGYSKAMEKYKLNRTVEQFNYLIQGMLEHTDSLRDKSNSSYQYGLVDVVQALNLVPETWERVDHIRLTDEMGDTIQPFIRNGNITIDFYLGGKTVQESGGDLSYAFSDKLCREIVQNVFYPLHSAARAAHVLTDKSYTYYGNSFCADGRRCLKDITPIEINNICKTCEKGKQACILVLDM